VQDLLSRRAAECSRRSPRCWPTGGVGWLAAPDDHLASNLSTRERRSSALQSPRSADRLQ
jgi:hypothetical protein